MSKRIFYWDTSAILPLVFAEEHSKSVRVFLERENALPGYSCFFSLLEIESALNRRISEGTLKLTDLAEVRLKVRTLELGVSLIWPNMAILTESRKAAIQFNLRPGDALQLASCHALMETTHDIFFICLDARLNKSAKASNLNCIF